MPAPGLAEVDARAARDGLAILGAFHPEPADAAPEGAGTLALLGPAPGAFWPIFVASPEHGDGEADPLDRWSTRVIGAIAADFGAAAAFPFGGPPHAPFLDWARRSGSTWTSPVGLLVHARLGLFVSFRGALAFRERLALPKAPACPCDGCGAPCRDACPAGALGAGGYDVPACHAWLDTRAGATCLETGCAVRRACPVGGGAQPAAQTRFHMMAFHGRHGP